MTDFDGVAGGELGDADGNGDGAQHIAGGFLHQLAALHRQADLVGDMDGIAEAGAAQDDAEFLAAIAGGGVAALDDCRTGSSPPGAAPGRRSGGPSYR